MSNIREAIIQTAYHEIAAEKMLTIESVGTTRARVPVHWRDEAERRAKPYLDAIEGALSEGQETLAREVEAIAYGFGKYDGDGAVNFWDDEVDGPKFAQRLTVHILGGER